MTKKSKKKQKDLTVLREVFYTLFFSNFAYYVFSGDVRRARTADVYSVDTLLRAGVCAFLFS